MGKIKHLDTVIPIMHCFDNRYVIPASVSFISLLEHANPKYEYRLYVLHTDITLENQQKLQSVIAEFSNASLEFIDMNNKFDDLFNGTITKGHYSKEIYYKFLAPSIFPQYDYIVITDVDVVWQGDISTEYVKFSDDQENYFAGVVGPCLKNSWGEDFMQRIYKEWSPEERKKLITGAGFWIFNLKKMRLDACENKFVTFAKNNIHRLKQPEQDCVNSVCWPHIKKLPLSSMVCTYLYDLYQNPRDLKNDLVYSFDELSNALIHPIQVHYATEVKPWNTPFCTKAHLWYNYLIRTPFFYEQMKFFVSPFTKQKWYLFGLIPVLKIRYNAGKLFKFFPLKRRI